jgi:hypothetical protein
MSDTEDIDPFEKMFGKATPPPGKKYDFRFVSLPACYNPNVLMIEYSAAGFGFGSITFKIEDDGVVTLDTEMSSKRLVLELIDYLLEQCKDGGKQFRPMFNRLLKVARAEYDYSYVIRQQDTETIGVDWKLKKDLRIFPRSLHPLEMAILGVLTNFPIKDLKNWSTDFANGVDEVLAESKAGTIAPELKQEIEEFFEL